MNPPAKEGKEKGKKKLGKTLSCDIQVRTMLTQGEHIHFVILEFAGW